MKPFFVVRIVCLVLSFVCANQVAAQDSLQKDYRSELQRIAPLEPAEALAAFQLDEALAIEAVASEPMVMDPVAIAFDEWGKAFVVEMRGYSERSERNMGRISCLQDVDGDGWYETATLFASGFRWPTAIVCVKGGVLVGDAPDLVFLSDRDGDGIAEDRHILFTGFGTSNVQQLPNSFQWGIDNQIYGASGGNGGALVRQDLSEVPRFSRLKLGQQTPVNLRGRDFQIDPQTMRLSAISGGTQFGMTFDRWGARFVCSNSDHCQQVIIEEKYARRNPLHPLERTRVNIAVDGAAAPVFRISPVEPWRKVRTRLRVQGLVRGPIEGGGRAAGYFTSATGLTCFQGDLMPADYRGDLFVGDVGSNLVHRKKLVGNGIQKSAVRTELKTEFLRTSDNWFRPVQMANAPDGSLIILDMYRETIEHPASLPPLIKKHLDLNSGNDRGRIYRVRSAHLVSHPRLMPGNASDRELVKMLAHGNGWHRSTAARLLAESFDQPAAESICNDLRELALRSPVPESRIRAMYLLRDLGAVDESELLAALADAHPYVRVHALRIAESQLTDRLEQQIVSMTADEDARVRFQVALSLGECGNAPDQVAKAIAQLAIVDGSDRWIRSALENSSAGHQASIIQFLFSRGEMTGVSASRQVLVDLIKQLVLEPAALTNGQLARVWSSWPVGQDVLLGETLAKLAPKQIAIIEGSLESGFEVTWLELRKRLVSVAVAAAVNGDLQEVERVRAIEVLRMAQSSELIQILDSLLGVEQPPAVKRAVINVCKYVSDPIIGSTLLAHFPELSPALRANVLSIVAGRAAWSIELLNQIQEKQLSATLVDASTRQRLQNSSNKDVKALANAVLAVASGSDRNMLVQKYLKAVGELTGDERHGRELFRKSCSACHQLEEQGQPIGPNLAAFANRGAAAMVANIIAPNQEVDPRYLSFLVQLDDGRSLIGIIDNETATTITIRNTQAETTTVLRSEIDAIRSTTLSLMPENFEAELSTQDMSDLIAYLLSQGS